MLGLTVLVSDALLLLPRCCLRSRCSCTSAVFPPSWTMENSRLPIEVCERVIDEFLSYYWTHRNRALVACALTCSAWLPRSQYNLLREVHVVSENVSRVMDAFTSRPALAGCARVIDIKLYQYAPLTQVLSSLLLQKCQRLELSIDWRCFPSRYVQNCLVPLLTNFASVVEFDYAVWPAASGSTADFFHIIWAMPQLLSCILNVVNFGKMRPIVVSLANLKKTVMHIQPRLCLRTLIIQVSSQC